MKSRILWNVSAVVGVIPHDEKPCDRESMLMEDVHGPSDRVVRCLFLEITPCFVAQRLDPDTEIEYSRRLHHLKELSILAQIIPHEKRRLDPCRASGESLEKHDEISYRREGLPSDPRTSPCGCRISSRAPRDTLRRFQDFVFGSPCPAKSGTWDKTSSYRGNPGSPETSAWEAFCS